MLCQVSHVSFGVDIYTWLYFIKSAKLVKVTALVRMSLKCFVTGLMWLIPILLLLVNSVYYVSHNTIHLHYACFNT